MWPVEVTEPYVVAAKPHYIDDPVWWLIGDYEHITKTQALNMEKHGTWHWN
jgi:hypothetical protein